MRRDADANVHMFIAAELQNGSTIIHVNVNVKICQKKDVQEIKGNFLNKISEIKLTRFKTSIFSF